jgi:hypothetical protein
MASCAPRARGRRPTLISVRIGVRYRQPPTRAVRKKFWAPGPCVMNRGRCCTRTLLSVGRRLHSRAPAIDALGADAVAWTEGKLMSREHRTRVDAMVRGPSPTGPRPIEEMRAGFAALMAMMRVPEQVRPARSLWVGVPPFSSSPNRRGGRARSCTSTAGHSRSAHRKRPCR